MADTIVVLRAGAVEQVGAPLELYNHPANVFVAGFIGSPRMNLLKGKVHRLEPSGVAVELPGHGVFATMAAMPRLREGDDVTLGIRPEHIRLDGDHNLLGGTVAGVEQLGGLSYIRLADPEVTVQLPGQTRLGFGDHARVHLPPEMIHLFDADGLAVPCVGVPA